ncbi:glycosyltransferase family 2 protein [Ramlibacter montanisoli]|uniref:Glycosyltransferase family 2 protein n=1 Tax=Ramlibacter montanisoli TaxID=2732512 RepID=A0A849KHV8_9BURK|nr:glycosyltransferase [Ramlibacter montanisoli]NNU43653.1 glycosyltransferase family 2 protein [Ramlibacter montanisoli]
MIKVSVMIPTYNQAGFVREAIASALAQTHPHLEVIVGDDASSDDTAAVVAAVADPRLRYVRHSANLGRTGNYRALLYEHATGDFVVNLDGDDYFTDPEFIARAVRCVEADPEVVMVVAQVTSRSETADFVSQLPPHEELAGLDILRRLPARPYLLMHMGVLYARRAALAIDFYRSPAISSDWESLYRLCLRGKVRYLPRPVGVWRVHGGNETGTGNVAKLLANLDIWEPVYRDAVKFGMSPLRARLARARMVAFLAVEHLPAVSHGGNRALVAFLGALAAKDVPALLFIALHPRSAATLAAGFLGYFRRDRALATR